MRKNVFRLTVIAAAIGLVQLAPVPMAWSAPATRTAVVPGAVLRGGAELAFPASHVGVRWQGDEEAAVEVRWDGGPWQPVHHNEDMTTGDVVYADLVGVGRAERVEARVVAGEARDVQVVAIDTRHGPRRLVRAGRSGAPATASMSDTRVAQPGVVSRAQWGADESIRNPGPPSFAPVRKLIVHHTDTPNGDPDPAATVRAIYSYHVQTRGWNDIGYNFLIDERGRIYEGRWSREYAAGEIPTGEDTEGRGVIGAHAEGANTGSVGVALLGTFTAQGPSSAAVEALQAMLAWKADRHSINVLSGDSYPNLAGHRDTKATSCPGDRLYDRLPEIRRRVSDIVASAHGRTKGYWVTTNDGQVLPFGEAGSFGSMAGHRLNSPVLGMAATTTHAGYWLLA
ncbi:MAG TPA: peptidoglycan recognition protein, partial [Acidimicrobiales bacterium]|nr:peptidoglycan recognition protein [Acidimicrobiales bacterium]